ncbi:hypothetical protein O181_037592 [Austropuccinia psidii MF-1]|uniref:Uncharacterized protein n=1 Tax=Austropuccinia psidii MF-1 TaxID=1389203 RepID=A0A9Q3HB26_9BASI|nr:hypothetical protein [Austropuccinia psidii MF-1]
MQHGVNNSGIYPHQNIYRQCDDPLHVMEDELNHVILAMPDNDSHKRNEREIHQVIASSNNLLHVIEELDLPVQLQTSQTHESTLSKQTSVTFQNEKQKRKQCTKKELEHDKRHHIIEKSRNNKNPPFIQSDFEHICSYLEDKENYHDLFGDSKKTSWGKKKKHTHGQAFKCFAIYWNSHHEEGTLNLSGFNLQQHWRTYKRKFVQTAQFLKGTAIFGNKQNVIGHNVFDSMTKIIKELDTDKHSINSYESDTKSQGISDTENLYEKDVSIQHSTKIVISVEDSQLEGSDHSTTTHKEEINQKVLSIKITSSKFHKRKHFGNQTQNSTQDFTKKKKQQSIFGMLDHKLEIQNQQVNEQLHKKMQYDCDQDEKAKKK